MGNDTGFNEKIDKNCKIIPISQLKGTAPENRESQKRKAPSPRKNSLKPSISKFEELIGQHFGAQLRLNEMSGRREYYDLEQKSWLEWTDVRECHIKSFFQDNYDLFGEKMLQDALTICFDERKYNPLRDLLNSLSWDGKPRMTLFLTEIMGCPDSDYYREAARQIFAGGVHRVFRPGAKFDQVPVFIGKQGCGKSTVVRWLNMNDVFFRELKTFQGKESIESLQGGWIIEISELMAIRGVRLQETAKAFLSAQEDFYRVPYGHNPQSFPRRCIFIGSTNSTQFLTDPTGNRRYLPIYCECDGFDIVKREQEIREYIRQCWAEAVVLYKEGRLSPNLDVSVLSEVVTYQQAAETDDWRVGAIASYLEDMKDEKDAVISVIELWHNALNMREEIKPTRKDSNEIVEILQSLGWQRKKSGYANTNWGRQKAYEKKSET